MQYIVECARFTCDCHSIHRHEKSNKNVQNIESGAIAAILFTIQSRRKRHHTISSSTLSTRIFVSTSTTRNDQFVHYTDIYIFQKDTYKTKNKKKQSSDHTPAAKCYETSWLIQPIQGIPPCTLRLLLLLMKITAPNATILNIHAFHLGVHQLRALCTIRIAFRKFGLSQVCVHFVFFLYVMTIYLVVFGSLCSIQVLHLIIRKNRQFICSAD